MVRLLVVSGIFYVCTLHNIAARNPVWSVNAPTAVKVECNRTCGLFLFSRYNKQILSVMHSTEKNCLNGQTTSNSNRATCVSGNQSFSFEGTYDVQVVMHNGEPWFIAVEICNLLGLSNPTKALYGLEHDEYLTLPIVRAGQQRLVNLVNESGLYALIFQSRKPIAKKFRKWVTREVLPAIRKTGMYVTEKKAEELTGQYVQVTGMNNNLYISAVMKSFREFLQEEAQGKVFTERRLNDKINAARVLFPEGKIAFRNKNVKNRMK